MRPPPPRVDHPQRTDPSPALPRAPAPLREYHAESRGDPGVFQSLTDTCRYWTEQNTRGQYSGNEQIACNQMNQYARDFGMRAPAISGRGPALPAQRHAPQANPSVYVDECERFGRTTIAFRQCRAAEQDRLTNSCHSLRTQFDRAAGAHRDNLRRQMQAVCSEASRYQIVR